MAIGKPTRLVQWPVARLLRLVRALRPLVRQVPSAFGQPGSSAIFLAWTRTLTDLERQTIGLFLRAHISAIDAVKAGLTVAGPLDVDRLTRPAEDRLKESTRRELIRSLVRASERGTQFATRQLDRLCQVPPGRRAIPRLPRLVRQAPLPPRCGVDFQLVLPEIEQYISARVRRFSPRLARESIDRYRAVLRRGVRQGLSIQAIRDEILDLELPRISRARAVLIARTEVNSAANQAALSVYRSTAGVIQFKGWLNARDGKVRPSHRYAGIVPVEAPFVLPSGARLMYPGDGSLGAPVSELAHCRCTMVPIIRPAAPRRRGAA